MIVLFALIGFLSGSMMFSYWLGLLASKNIRHYGDGNPGAFNLWHVAGYKHGILGVILDFLKGYIPISFMMSKGYVSGTGIVPVAVATILGHVFSPFLKWRGGKGIAVTFGVWSALTSFRVSIAYAVILAMLYVIAVILNKGKATSSEVDGLMVVVGMLTLVLFLYYKSYQMYIYDIWFANLLIITYTNREKLYKLYKDVYEKRHEKNAVTR
ncbi:Glycerol-3-phosphate acyltransferase [Thermoanaerobacterium aotearoense SCUT27]|uniref:Glycerol-3-phosphate acyltransferase n=2 Tax=Thermoanaerobacterium TaxID=28895 RepID=W9E8I8_9THEO|nr:MULTISPECIES: glycerol-3-phosphate acyltransferase [Thermoanaerobacterium]AFK86209.1 Glycerol-3-phosphate acyltransferase [Thermoanaerobacterium saccharolyticum JW/SL-YS485]ETO37296.1 Glycerol-3-phosphate acyltransferase [Thermoanaerobacterium aotearoense SCUT27]